jgi:chemotaxis protein methyltransferase CheR
LTTTVFHLDSYANINIYECRLLVWEETHSLNILLKENDPIHKKTRLYATDISSHAIEKSRKGIYSNTNFKEYSKTILSVVAKTFELFHI